ncbi:MAG: DUF481 domain-containing protein [Ignavibacteria bacterium]|nr:DUF481 domain-containing protein [Ignavibacteria bacterium]
MNRIILLISVIILSFNNLDYAQVNTERFREDEDSIGFSGFIDLEGILATGNTDFQLISLGGRLNYNWGDDYTFLIADGGYGWENSSSFVDQILAHLRHVITTGDLIQIELFTQFDNNKKRLLLARELLGGGLRFRILKTEHVKFRLGTAYMFETEKYDLPENAFHHETTSLHRFTSYITLSFKLNKTISFISTTYYQPSIIDFNDYKLFSENALLVDAGEVFNIFIKFNLRYDSRPPDAIKDFDTISRMGFSFKFGGG